MKPSDLRNLTDVELSQELNNLKTRLFRIREGMVVEASNDLKDYRTVKKDIARINTIITERKSKK